MTNKKFTLEQAQDILNKSYRASENDYTLFPYYMHGSWVIKYNRNNNNTESDFHALEERFLYYSGDMPKLIGSDGHFAIGNGNRLFWENDIQNMTTEEFIKLCNEEFTTIIDGSERNKLYKEYIKKYIEQEKKRTYKIQENFNINKRKKKIANSIFNTILFIVTAIILWILIIV